MAPANISLAVQDEDAALPDNTGKIGDIAGFSRSSELGSRREKFGVSKSVIMYLDRFDRVSDR